LRLNELKTNNKSKKSESVVFKTRKSLARLDSREKHLNERIVKLQKRIDAVSKLGLKMQGLKEKQKEITDLKKARITEIQALIATFGSTIPAEQVS
jgi:hypothetical protein